MMTDDKSTKTSRCELRTNIGQAGVLVQNLMNNNFHVTPTCLITTILYIITVIFLQKQEEYIIE